MNPKRLTAVIVGEGTSDAALESPIRWLMKEIAMPVAIEFVFTSNSSDTSRKGLAEKVNWASKCYEPDIIFIHRDGDSTGYKARLQEIKAALSSVEIPYAIPVIPICMMEAWLLIDEQAIRVAAGNPKGKSNLDLPKTPALEKLSDPKTKLLQTLRDATGYSGRKLKKFSAQAARQRVAEEITDYSPLLKLSAFSALSDELKQLKASLEGS